MPTETAKPSRTVREMRKTFVPSFKFPRKEKYLNMLNTLKNLNTFNADLPSVRSIPTPPACLFLCGSPYLLTGTKFLAT